MRARNPACKFISLLALTFVVAAAHDPILNGAVFLLSLVLLLVSRVQLKTILLLMLPLLLAATGMFFTGYRFSAAGSTMPVRAESLHIGSNALWNALTLSSRVLAYGFLGLLFALTTDRARMVKSFRRQFHLPQMFAYGLLAAWGLFPQMVREFKRTRLAFRARGILISPLSPRLLSAMLIKSVRWSEALSVAMESKGFSGSAVRSEFEPVHVRAADIVMLILCCIAVPLAVMLTDF